MSDADPALLVVDDIEDNRFALSRRLARLGYLNVMTAVDGRQALELLKSKPFDLVLLDIMMPNVNGYEVLAAIKASENLRHIPVIMISAVDEIDSVVRCVELGAEDYCPSPSIQPYYGPRRRLLGAQAAVTTRCRRARASYPRRWSSRPRPRRCCRSSQARPGSSSRYSKPCWRMRPASARRSSVR